MKRLITAVMAGMIAATFTGCATLNTKTSAELQEEHWYAKALVSLGDAEYVNKNYEKALGHYDNALRDWDNYRVYAKIAYCLKNMGNIADAKMVYKKALAMAPKINENNKRGGTSK